MTDDRVRFTDDQAAWSKASCVRQNYWKDDAILKIVPKGLYNPNIRSKVSFRTQKIATHSCNVFYEISYDQYDT